MRHAWAVVAGLWLFLLAGPALASTEARFSLTDSQPRVDLWPYVTVLERDGDQLTIDDLLANKPRFTEPQTAYGTLGMRDDAIWLHIPVATSTDTDGRWVLDLDYPVVNRVDAYLVSGEIVQESAKLGNLVPRSQKPLDSRALSYPLQLQANQSYDIYLRVKNEGSMILPLTLVKPKQFHKQSLNEQMLQGVLTGLALCLLVYSLAQWLSLREHLFVKYAILISGSLMFNLLQFGIGAQYLWGGSAWMEVHAGGLSAMIAATGSFLFIEHALSGHNPTWLRQMMKGGAVLMVAFALGYALDWLNIHQVTMIVSTLGLAPALLGLPGAFRRARMGDHVGGYFLLAWAIYFATTAILIEVIKGRLAANFWTLHSFQFGATVDMLVFMRVLGLRTKALQVAIQRAQVERESLRVMAHTDPLTGLPNRRSLVPIIEAALASAQEGKLLGLYMLDLDGFKQVNDRYGHAVGDDLLVEVSSRLTSTLRNADVIARLGGDEFLVIAKDLPSEEAAQELGEKLLRPIEEPFVLSRHTCRVGVTIGYALAPLNASDARQLLEMADAAMYSGKQSGKHCVKRAVAMQSPHRSSPRAAAT